MTSLLLRVCALCKWPSLLLLCVGFTTGCAEGPKAPGESEFEAANKLIGINSGGIAFGDSPASQEAAMKFANAMKGMQAVLFSGGSGRSFASGGEFLTYLRKTDNAVVVLCHVPELRHYKDTSVRESLGRLAWLNAQSVAAELSGVTSSTTLMIGLRGFASYGPIWEGNIVGEAKKKTDDLTERKRFYPFFAPAAESTKPSAPAQTPVAEPAAQPAA